MVPFNLVPCAGIGRKSTKHAVTITSAEADMTAISITAQYTALLINIASYFPHPAHQRNMQSQAILAPVMHDGIKQHRVSPCYFLKTMKMCQ